MEQKGMIPEPYYVRYGRWISEHESNPVCAECGNPIPAELTYREGEYRVNCPDCGEVFRMAPGYVIGDNPEPKIWQNYLDFCHRKLFPEEWAEFVQGGR